MSLFGKHEKKLLEKYRVALDEQRNRVAELEKQLTPEHKNIDDLKNEISVLVQNREEIKLTISEFKDSLQDIKKQIQEKRNEVIILDDDLLIQSFGLYKPQYEFITANEYRIELEKIRSYQKDLIRRDEATTGNMNWTVNGNVAQGRKMVRDMQRLLLRAFNNECDEIVSKVRYHNFDPSLKRISSSYNAITKLGTVMSISVSQLYYNSKVDELRLAFEYQQKKQQEKEEQRDLRDQLREEAKLQKEIDDQRRKLEKEQNHYQNALARIEIQIGSSTGIDLDNLLIKKQEIINALDAIDKAYKEVDYRQANQKAGYVYIISNIGSFGENVYKIGMTRRLDPQERIDELGDASVPFRFDVHAMIFCDDAPALESALHKSFEDRKLNMINSRREFFRVTLDEIKSVVAERYDKTVEFVDHADAEQFRVSEKMKLSRR